MGGAYLILPGEFSAESVVKCGLIDISDVGEDRLKREIRARTSTTN